MDPVLKRFRNIFLEEASGLLDQVEKDLLDLEISPDNMELIESAFRAMHTLKGNSGMYGFMHVSDFTHNLESLYQSVRDNVHVFNKEIFDVSFASIDHIRKLLSDEDLSIPENQMNQTYLKHKIELILKSIGAESEINTVSNENKNENVPGTWQILLRTSEKMYLRGINLLNIFQDLGSLGSYIISKVQNPENKDTDTWSIILSSAAKESEIYDVFLFIEDDCTITRISSTVVSFPDELGILSNEPSILDYINGNQKKLESNFSENNEILKTNDSKVIKRISVDSNKLDYLMYLVSEFITINSQFSLNINDGNEKLRSIAERMDALSKQFRNNALDLRLVSLNESVLRFKRLIRDLSKKLHKKIDLVTEGTDTELDKGTIDQLNDPLMHIIRNCIDHGIELPDIRKKLGKSETGIIKISASHAGNQIIIKVEDDGAGIDLQKIEKHGRDKGLINKEILSRKELLEMIFLPGFSTAKNISEVSGRGVGMDVVKRKINDMRGEIEVDSTTGTGTSFTLRIQQSMSIIDTLLFKIQSTYFTVAISEINKCIEIPRSEIIRNKHTSTLKFEEDLIPYFDLREKLKLGGIYNETVRVIVLQKNEKLIALLTDSLIGGHQAVLKPLGNFFQNTKYINSASQLGDGDLSFMIDTGELFLAANIF